MRPEPHPSGPKGRYFVVNAVILVGGIALNSRGARLRGRRSRSTRRRESPSNRGDERSPSETSPAARSVLRGELRGFIGREAVMGAVLVLDEDRMARRLLSAKPAAKSQATHAQRARDLVRAVAGPAPAVGSVDDEH